MKAERKGMTKGSPLAVVTAPRRAVWMAASTAARWAVHSAAHLVAVMVERTVVQLAVSTEANSVGMWDERWVGQTVATTDDCLAAKSAWTGADPLVVPKVVLTAERKEHQRAGSTAGHSGEQSADRSAV